MDTLVFDAFEPFLKEYKDILRNINVTAPFTYLRNGLYESAATNESDQDACDLNALNWATVETMTNKLNATQRIIFLTVTSVLIVLSVFGNFAAIYVAFRMKHRVMYKNCLVSLAISDLCLTLVTGTNNMFRFSQPWIDWALGDFMCSLIPMVQTMCVLGNSMTLTCVALDRYQCVVNALRGRWDPNAWICAACMTTIWLSAAGVSAPMFFAYNTHEVNVITVDHNTSLILNCREVDMCITEYKQNNHMYFSAVFTLIFLPLICTFLALHGIIAVQIWKRRKPVSAEQQESSSGKTQSSDIATSLQYQEDNNETMKKGKPETPRFIFNDTSKIAWNSPKNTENSSPSSSAPNPTAKNAQMARKLRTFKIIIAVMVLFFVCRLPSWIFLLIVTSEDYEPDDGTSGWLLQYSFSTLSLLNSAANPYMYGFINEFLNMWKSACAKVSRVLCCCCCKCGDCSGKRCDARVFCCHRMKGGDGEVAGICAEEGIQQNQDTMKVSDVSSDYGNKKPLEIKSAAECSDPPVESEDYGGVYPFHSLQEY